MGATSVTGVSGPGSVEGLQKGSERMSLGIGKLVGPKVSAAGSATLVGTTGTVSFPALVGLPANYVVILTGNSATVPYVSTALATVGGSGDWSFVITAGNNAVVGWAVVKMGL